MHFLDHKSAGRSRVLGSPRTCAANGSAGVLRGEGGKCTGSRLTAAPAHNSDGRETGIASQALEPET